MDGASSTGLTKILASATLDQTLSTTAANGRTIEVDGLYDLSSASTTNVFASGAAALIHVVSGGSLRRSGNGTASINVPVNNQGTIDVAAGTLILAGVFGNYNSTSHTLTGGAYVVAGTLQFTSADVRTNAATIALQGTGTLSDGSLDRLRNFATNAAGGELHLALGKTMAAPGAVSNAGTLTVDSTSTFQSGPVTNTGSL